METSAFTSELNICCNNLNSAGKSFEGCSSVISETTGLSSDCSSLPECKFEKKASKSHKGPSDIDCFGSEFEKYQDSCFTYYKENASGEFPIELRPIHAARIRRRGLRKIKGTLIENSM